MLNSANAFNPLRIDIVSDVMCPWCIIGYLQLKKALEQTNTEADIHWHPFELNPNMPEEGQNVREHIVEKYGITPQQSDENRQRLVNVGKELGFEFNYADDSKMHNSFKMHQLLHWASLQDANDNTDKQHQLKLALFKAHFTDRLDVSDNTVLADIASQVGLDKNEALAVLQDERFANTVKEEEKYYIDQGIQGVPAIILDNKYLVSGAQGVDNFASVIKQVETEKSTDKS